MSGSIQLTRHELLTYNLLTVSPRTDSARIWRKPRFIRFVTATERHTPAGTAPALSGAEPPDPAPGAPRCRSGMIDNAVITRVEDGYVIIFQEQTQSGTVKTSFFAVLKNLTNHVLSKA